VFVVYVPVRKTAQNTVGYFGNNSETAREKYTKPFR
jgi:hypothetical protein